MRDMVLCEHNHGRAKVARGKGAAEARDFWTLTKHVVRSTDVFSPFYAERRHRRRI